MTRPTVEADGEGGAIATIRVVGDLDLMSAEEVATTGRRCLENDATHTLVIDMAVVDFLDSSGVSTLVHLRNEAIALGKTVRLAGCGRQARRVLEITGLADTFELEA